MLRCKLIIKDEVNIKFEGLAIETRRKIANKLKYDLPYAKHMPSYKLGRWDGTKSFFGIGGTGYLAHLDTILPIIENDYYDIEVEDLRMPYSLSFTPVTEHYWADQGKTWPTGHPAAGDPIVLRDYQYDVVNKFLENPQSLQEVATGAGKCQPLSSKVLTSIGWKTMEEIEPGEMVVTPTGKSVKVLETYEPGEKDVYEITFQDGRTARCCKDHIWRIYNIGWGKSKTGPWRNITTEELINLKKATNRSIGVPLVSMEHDCIDKELPLDPWLLGFLLGDGSFRNGTLCFSSSDTELIDKVKSKLTSEYTVKHIGNYDYCIKFSSDEIAKSKHSEHMKLKERTHLGHIINSTRTSANEYIKALTEMNLMETYSHNKFVPRIYFNASYSQRLELIRGLVDSDGTVDKSSAKFTSVGKQLAYDFAELIHSIGGIAKIFPKINNTYTYNNNKVKCKDSYTVATKFKEPWKLMSLMRKVEKTNYKYQYGPTLKLNVVDIKKVSREPVKCILIDDPAHLYVTDGYVVTHNTITAATLSQLCEPYGRTVLIVPNKSLVVQTEEDYVNLGLDVGVYFGDRKELNHTHTICTWQSLNVLDKKSYDNDALTLAEFANGVSAVIVDECLAGDTMILTPTGKTRIDELVAGDRVINLCERTLSYKEDVIVKLHKNLLTTQSEAMLELQFDNGEVIQVTANHKFLTSAGWIRADALTSEMDIIDVSTYQRSNQ